MNREYKNLHHLLDSYLLSFSSHIENISRIEVKLSILLLWNRSISSKEKEYIIVNVSKQLCLGGFLQEQAMLHTILWAKI